MSTLHLGVVDIPYTGKLAATVAQHYAALGKGKPLSRHAASGSVTTGQVAQYLEDKYKIMETFWSINSEGVADSLANALAGTLESMALGAPPPDNPFAAATDGLVVKFHKFLESGLIEHLGAPGVPTKAALAGVSHRKKHPYAKSNARRPSFIDTGLYLQSFAAWVDK